MEFEIVITGDELTSGEVQDANAAWLAGRVTSWGGRLRRMVAVGDRLEDLVRALHEAVGRGGVVVVTCGPGSAGKALALRAAALVPGDPLVPELRPLESIVSFWRSLGREPPDAAAPHAPVPLGARVLENPCGRTPGLMLPVGEATCFFFAGRPVEFQGLCERHLAPLVAGWGLVPRLQRTLRCVGLRGGEVEARLLAACRAAGVGLRLRELTLEVEATLVAPPGSSPTAFGVLVTDAARRLGTHCYSSRGESLAAVTSRLCRERAVRVAVAESCTGGLLGAALTEEPGSSAYFLGGVLAYADEEKVRALGVPAPLLAEHGAVSDEVAGAMAEGVRARTGASHALAITGVAGPGGGTADKPVGTVWIALATAEVCHAQRWHFAEHGRAAVRAAAVCMALNMLRQDLMRPA